MRFNLTYRVGPNVCIFGYFLLVVCCALDAVRRRRTTTTEQTHAVITLLRRVAYTLSLHGDFCPVFLSLLL